jgi:hypothetical protein
MHIPQKNGTRNHGRKSQKYPEWERNKRRSLGRRAENSGAVQSLQTGLSFRTSTADGIFGILAAGSHNKAISVQL